MKEAHVQFTKPQADKTGRAKSLAAGLKKVISVQSQYSVENMQ